MSRPTPPETSWWLPTLELRSSPIHGVGVFTSTPLQQGAVVIVWGGRLLTSDDLSKGMGRAHTVVQIDEELFLGALPTDEKTLDDYMNHSCEPTVWLRDSFTLEARRDLAAGEELTADYAIWLDNPEYHLPCNCGSTLCRHLVTGVDWKLPALQDVYQGHFATFLNARITAGAL